MPAAPSSARLDAIRQRLTSTFKTVGSLLLLTGVLSVLGTAVAATVAVAPTGAANPGTTCTAPTGASTTTTTTTFVDGQASNYNVQCYEQTDISGTAAYPTIAITSGSLPTGATFAGSNQTSCSSSSGGTTTTSGSGTTEEYILQCNIAYTPPANYNTPAAVQFTVTPTGGYGAATVSSTLDINFVAPSTPTCIDPATAGSTATFDEGTSSLYTVECEQTTGVASLASYPTQITIASGSFPSSTPHMPGGTSTGTEPGTPGSGTGTNSTTACGTTTSGTGTTEDYILECDFQDSPVPADAAGNPNVFTFNATNTNGVTSGNGTSGANSGNLSVTVQAATTTCIDPASGGSSVTFVEGTNATYNVECEATSGISGVTAYPSSISVNSGALPADANQKFGGSAQTTCGIGSGATTTTSGTGATEDYITECALSGDTTPADAGASPYPFNFTATGPGGDGTSATSGTLTVNVGAPTVTCIDPASGGSSATFAEGTDATYQVECEATSGISGVTAYPSSITVNSGAFPADANQTFGGSAQTTCGIGSGATTTTSGTGATEDYITECALTADTTAADATGGPNYLFNFTATGPGGDGGTAAPSGTLTAIAATPKATGCIDPASAGSTTTFGSSAGGTPNSYTTECYAESGVTGVTAYPATVTPTGGTGLPGDATFGGNGPTSACGIGSGATTTTSGSATTEEYITECAVAEDAVSADNGTYTSNFQSSAAGATASGLLTINVSGPSDICLDPASAGSTTTFREGIANTYTVECYGTGFGTASPNNYPASITANNVTPSGTFLDGTANFPSGSNPPTTCAVGSGGTTTTSGSGLTEEYILECTVADTPSASATGSYVASFTAQPGSAGGNTITSGNLTVNDSPVTSACLDPASGGTTTTMYAGGGAQSYTVECYGQSGISGETAYPTSIAVGSGAFPVDASQTFGGSAQTSCGVGSGGTTTTSGTGTTEEYILECALGATPQADDAGSYPFTFTSTSVDGVNTTTSGTLTVKIQAPTTTCSAPAAAGTTTTFTDGTAGSYSVTCYTQGFSSANAGNYPASINITSGSLPAQPSGITYGGSYQTTCSVSSGSATTTTSGSGVTEEYETVCKVAGTPAAGYEGTYPLGFTANPGSVAAADGATAVTSGTLNLKIVGAAPTIHSDQYFLAVSGKPFCFDFAMDTTDTLANGGLPLTNLTAGTTPANVTGYGLKNVNLVAGTAQICGTASSSLVATTSEVMAPVATNSEGSVTGSIDLSAYDPANWVTSGANESPGSPGATSTSAFDSNQDIYTSGAQAAFGDPITGGLQDVQNNGNPAREAGTITLVPLTSGSNTITTATTSVFTSDNGSTEANLVGDTINVTGLTAATVITAETSSGSPVQYTFTLSNPVTTTESSETVQVYSNSSFYPICTESGVQGGTADCGIGIGGLGNSPTLVVASPLPTPIDPNANSTANLGSVDLDLGTDTSEAYPTPPTGGCWGTANITLSGSGFTNEAAYGTTDEVVVPSPWVAGGDCAYGSLGSNSASGDSPESPNEQLCPPTQTEVDAGMVDCSATAASGNDGSGANTSFNYSTDQLFFSGQPVPQTSTVNLSTTDVQPGDSVTITGGTNWWGAGNTNEPNSGCVSVSPAAEGGIGACAPLLTSSALTSGSPVTSLSFSSALTSTITSGDTIFVTSSGHSQTFVANETVTSGSSSVTVNSQNASFSFPVGSYVEDETAGTTGGATYGASQVGDYYPLGAPQVYIGTNSASAHAAGPVPNNVNLWASSYNCTGTSTTTNGNISPCTLEIGGKNPNYASVNSGSPGTAGISGTFTVPSNLAPGTYNVYVDADNATSLPGNGPVDASNYPASPNGDTNPSIALGTDEAVTTIDVEGVVVVKTSTTSAYGSAGQILNYNYAVTNTGPDTLTNIAVNDNLIPSVSCPSSSLAGGANETCTGSYTTTQADVDRGYVTNTATVSATTPTNENVTSAPSSATVYASNATSSLSLVKSTTTSAYGAAGQTIDYDYLVTNTGTTTENDISVSDNLVPSVSCPDSSLAPGASETCTGSYTVDQADVDNGFVTNTASASGENASDTQITSNQSSVTVLASDATSSLSLTKSSLTSGYGEAGDTINYDYVVTNTGTTTESNIGVSDNLVASVDCPDSSLAPGASETCTGSYTVDQADVDAGSVMNTAMASATNPSSDTITSNSSSVTVPASDATSSLSLVKSSITSAYGATGDTIDYDYVVTNTGTTTISGIGVSDNLVASVNCPDPSLTPGASETCTGSYTVDQADVDAGSVTNTATASGTNPQDATITSNSSSVTVEASNSTSTLSLTKSSLTSSYAAVGDMITYNYVITNTGTTTITGISVSDNLVASVDCPDSTLAPGASETCSGTYTVTQGDVNHGSVTNTATASGTNGQDVIVTSNQSSVTVPGSGAYDGLSLTKTSTTPIYDQAGDVINYNYVVTNTGTTTITGIGVSDNLVSSVSCPDPTLAPGDSETCTGSYTVTESDVLAGSVTNTATASGTDPSDSTVTSNLSSATVPSSYTATSTTPSSSTSALGGSNTDVAQITGNDVLGNPTGKVTFYECGPTATPEPCTSQANQVGGAVSVSPSGSDQATATSGSFTADQTGYWCFAAYYGGDSNYDPSSDSGMHECYDVTSASTSTMTTPAHTSIVLGHSDTDGVVVTGNSAGGSPTGSVTFYECGPTNSATPCTSEANAVGSASLSPAGGNTATATSGSFTPTSTGYWCFAGVYSGDSNYNSSSDTSIDECVDVTPVPSSTVTTPADTSIVLGDSDTDGAVVTGNAAGGSPTGTVTFYECGPTGSATPCTSEANEVGSANLSPAGGNTATATSGSFTPTSTGYWCFAGVYSGDSNYNTSSDTSIDECVDVTSASTTTVTSPDTGSIVLGAADTDTATVTGNDAGGPPTGNVTFYECGETATATPCTSQANEVGSAVALQNATADTAFAESASFTPTSTGYWCLAGYYSGDSNYSSSSDTTIDECVDVTAASSSTVSSPSSSTAALDGPNSDTVLVTGNDGAANAPYPTGTVTFYTCGENVDPCTSATWHQLGSAVTLGTGSGNTNNAISATFDNTSPGTWCFASVYSGDSNYTGSSDNGSDECYTVSEASTSTVSAPTNSTITLGQGSTDHATVTGNASVGSPTGTVSFYECGPTSVATSCTSKANQVGAAIILTPEAGDAAIAASTSFTPPSAGYWCYGAYYSGDSNYKSSSDTSVDECVDVTSTLSIVTSSPLPSGTDHVKYHKVQLVASGGMAPYKWTISTGTLPHGITLSSAGLLSGTPTVSGTFLFTVKVKDSSSPKESTTKKFTLKIGG